MHTGASFFGGRGHDKVTDYMYQAAFYGGAGRDSARFCRNSTPRNTLIKVEKKTPTMCLYEVPAGWGRPVE
jgi:hypothetical protein